MTHIYVGVILNLRGQSGGKGLMMTVSKVGAPLAAAGGWGRCSHLGRPNLILLGRGTAPKHCDGTLGAWSMRDGMSESSLSRAYTHAPQRVSTYPHSQSSPPHHSAGRPQGIPFCQSCCALLRLRNLRGQNNIHQGRVGVHLPSAAPSRRFGPPLLLIDDVAGAFHQICIYFYTSYTPLRWASAAASAGMRCIAARRPPEL